MKTKHYLLAVLATLLLAGCYNDDKLWDAVNDQEQRIAALESWQKVVNNNIEAIQILVSGKHYITSVTPVTLEGKTLGYTISFNDCNPITIYNGEKGEQGDKGDQGPAGSTPVISIMQQPDGNWYWTLNGELMKDADGNSIRANGEDGADGQPGQSAPAPLLKTGQQLITDGTEGTWMAYAVYLSVDNGKTWKQVSGKDGADGSDGDSMFTSIDYKSDNDYVVFNLANGEDEILVPKYKGTSPTLELKCPKDTPWEIEESRVIECIITIPDNSTYQLEFIITPKGWTVEKTKEEGVLPGKLVTTLKVTAPQMDDLLTADREGKLIVMLNVDNDVSIIRTIDLSIAFDLSKVTIAQLLNDGYKGTFLIVQGEEISNDDWEALKKK